MRCLLSINIEILNRDTRLSIIYEILNRDTQLSIIYEILSREIRDLNRGCGGG